MSNQTGTEFYQARVEVLIGNRVMSNFIASAGLGLAGVGVVKIMTIDYKPGEQVDEARVSRAMDELINESRRQQTDFVIMRYKVLSINLVCQP